MNERIRAIWETNDSISVVWPETGSPVRVSAALLEKFAQLIVNECAEVGYRTHDDFMVKVKIKEHFGVEE